MHSYIFENQLQQGFGNQWRNQCFVDHPSECGKSAMKNPCHSHIAMNDF